MTKFLPSGERFCEKALKEIEKFLRKRWDESGLKGVVLGMSGGLDSSVTACLVSEALPNEKVLGLWLPEEGVSLESDLREAEGLAEGLGIGFRKCGIGEVVKKIKGRGSELVDGVLDRNSLINVVPRVRMVYTYFVANVENRLVVGTGNKSEILLGYFTKYGDGAADVKPLGDVFKLQVRELGRFLDLPESIVEKKPSAGLYRGQTDEEELGYGYEKLDPVLYGLFVEGFSVEDVAEKTGFREREVVEIKELSERNRHKRLPTPFPCIH